MGEIAALFGTARSWFLTLVMLMEANMGQAAAPRTSDGDISLPPPAVRGTVSVEETLASRRSIRGFLSMPLSLSQAGQLLWAAQGVTDPQGLRTAPSAGATYPLYVYLVAENVAGLDPGVYRYNPTAHTLTRTRAGSHLQALTRDALNQSWVHQAPAVVAFTARYHRTTDRYGPRGRRYVDMEVGHAVENLLLQAVALGLGTVVVGAFRDDGVQRTLSLEPQEIPLSLVPVGTPRF